MGCSVCGKYIEPKVYNYSMYNFGKALCREHQPTNKTFNGNFRSKITPEARILCDALRDKGFNAQKEWSDGHKHVDIAVPEAMTYIEIDGCQHNLSPEQALTDLKRTMYSSKEGYVTLPIPNSLVRNNPDKAAEILSEILSDRRQAIEEYSEKNRKANGGLISRLMDWMSSY